MVTLLDGVTGEVLAGPVELPDITPASISAFGGTRGWGSPERAGS
jgi:hypothetical protein